MSNLIFFLLKLVRDLFYIYLFFLFVVLFIKTLCVCDTSRSCSCFFSKLAWVHKDIPTIYIKFFNRVHRCEPIGWPLTGSSRPSQKIRHLRKVPTSGQRLATIFPHLPGGDYFYIAEVYYRTARLKFVFCDFVRDLLQGAEG